MKRTTFYIPDEIHKDLQIRSAKLGLSMSSITTQVLQKWLKDEHLREQVQQGKA